MAYIYKITNLINNKIYIGKTSSSIQTRMKEHIKDSKKERQEKRPLYDAFNKYGIENFSIEAIEEVKNDEQASMREIYWINKLRTYIGFKDCVGYNATLGGDSKRYYDYKEIANAYLELGMVKKVCEKYGCDPKVVRNACKENNIKIAHSSNGKKKVKRISSNGEVKIYDSLISAAKDCVNSKTTQNVISIRKTISNGIKYHYKSYGYNWEFV